jgi:hypothetical protein
MGKRELIAQAALERCPSEIGTPSHTKVPCGYIMGATGWVCTQARLDVQVKQYPAYADKIRAYGPRWIGKKCYDCAQLSRVCAAAAGYKLVSGATSQWSQDIWEAKGTIDTLPADSRGIMLFRQDGTKMAHVAVCLGDGTEVEAMGHAYGVVRRTMAGRSFTHWARLKEIDIDGYTPPVASTPTDTTKPALRKGSKGADVTAMQQRLLAHGVALPKYGADGDFGAETEAAVKTFQGLHGLAADGVCGPATWQALLAEADTTPEAALYTVTVPGLTEAQADALLASWPRATKAVG